MSFRQTRRARTCSTDINQKGISFFFFSVVVTPFAVAKKDKNSLQVFFFCAPSFLLVLLSSSLFPKKCLLAQSVSFFFCVYIHAYLHFNCSILVYRESEESNCNNRKVTRTKVVYRSDAAKVKDHRWPFFWLIWKKKKTALFIHTTTHNQKRVSEKRSCQATDLLVVVYLCGHRREHEEVYAVTLPRSPLWPFSEIFVVLRCRYFDHVQRPILCFPSRSSSFLFHFLYLAFFFALLYSALFLYRPRLSRDTLSREFRSGRYVPWTDLRHRFLFLSVFFFFSRHLCSFSSSRHIFVLFVIHHRS